MKKENIDKNMTSIKELLDMTRIPRHVAVIMDGNGRWAKSHGKERVFGHQEGVDSVDKVTEAAAELGVEYLTLYAFSTENWNRPQAEVDALMEILSMTLRTHIGKISKNNVRLLVIGDMARLSDKTRENLQHAMDETAQNTGLKLVLALSYSARWEISNAAKLLAEDVKNGKVATSDIDEGLFSKYLTTKWMPDPDYLIRTSGEVRISNFLLWQLSYSELYFCDLCWPDFKKEQFYEAILDYQRRERRFGKTSEQVQNA
jgi:undecaprenyl diphosphate synthase